jgi:hypothetical protein
MHLKKKANLYQIQNNNSGLDEKIDTGKNSQPVIVVHWLDEVKLGKLNEAEHAIAIDKLMTVDKEQAKLLIISYNIAILNGDYETPMKTFNGLMKLARQGLLTDAKAATCEVKGKVSVTNEPYEQWEVKNLRELLAGNQRNEIIQKYARHGSLTIGTYCYSQYELERAGFPFNEVYKQTVPRSGGITSVGSLLGNNPASQETPKPVTPVVPVVPVVPVITPEKKVERQPVALDEHPLIVQAKEEIRKGNLSKAAQLSNQYEEMRKLTKQNTGYQGNADDGYSVGCPF